MPNFDSGVRGMVDWDEKNLMIYLSLTNLLFLLRYALVRDGILRRVFYFYVLMGLFVFSAFRYQVGCDWDGYYYNYLMAENFDWAKRTAVQEPIWWAILDWMQTYNAPYPIINVVSNAVFFLGVHILARRQPEPLAFLVMLFPILIINMPMSGIRQGAAIGMMCIAFVSFMDRRPYWFATWTILASGFHVSALLFLLAAPLASGKLTTKRLILAAVLLVPGVFFIAISAGVERAISTYIDSNIHASGAIYRVGLLVLTSLYFLISVTHKWRVHFPEDHSFVTLGVIMMMLVALLLPISSVMADRFAYYLIPIQTIIFARLPYLPRRFDKNLHIALPYFLLLIVFTVWTQSSFFFQRCYIPYQSWILGFPGGDSLGINRW